MILIPPVLVTPSTLTSSSITPEDSAAAWNSGTTYAADVFVRKNHRRWQSLLGSNTNHDPETSPTYWIDAGPTNQYAMFDESVGTLTTGTGEITVVINPGAIDALAIIDTDAEVVNVTMTVGGVEVYSASKSTNDGGSAINDWFLYFFAPLGKRTALTFLDLPVYSNGVITVELVGSNPAGPVSVGTLIVGRKQDIGSTEAGAKVGITDYSRKVTDGFGATTVEAERPWAKRMTLRTLCATDDVDSIQRTLAGVRAKPALWIGEEGFDSLTVYGFYKDFDIDLALRNISYCSLTIEGLT